MTFLTAMASFDANVVCRFVNTVLYIYVCEYAISGMFSLMSNILDFLEC